MLLLALSSVFLTTAFAQEFKKSRKGKQEATSYDSKSLLEQKGSLDSGIYHITQSWSEISNYNRPVHIQVPQGNGPFPVYIALHGRGGSGQRKLKNFRRMTDRIVIAPDGYNKGWSQKRPDVDFIRQIIMNIKKLKNVDGGNIAIHGSSNGAGLLNRLMIELEEDTFHHGICSIGGLTTNRHDGKSFLWDPNGGDSIQTPIIPARGRRWLQINGTEDQIVPYRGGKGTLGIDFIDAQDTFYLWAKHMGESGPKLPDSAGKPHPSNNKLVIYEYLDGHFKHIKGVGYKHGVNAREIKAIIHEFISQPPMSK